jgi:hypothetical protein
MPHCPSCDREVDGAYCPFDGTPLAHVGRAAALPKVGDQIDGRYVLLEELGRGGMAIVFRASNVTLGHDVAFKVLLPRYGEDRRMVTRFAREARAASQIDHVNVVKVYDFGFAEQGYYFLAMELLEGEPLRDAIRTRLSTARALSLLGRISAGMARAHELGVVHRDLKPENVMISRTRSRDSVTIVDFGLSKLDDGEQAALTREGDVIGTPDYMAPEQWRGQGVDARVDVYAFGCMAYELLTGALPFDGDSLVAKLSQHLHAQPLELAKHPDAHDLPPGISELVMKCLAKDRIDRYPHMGRVHAELEKIVGAYQKERREEARPAAPAPVATLVAPVEEHTMDRRELLAEITRLRGVRQHRLAELSPTLLGHALTSEVRALIAAIDIAEQHSTMLGEELALAEASLEEALRARRQKEAELRAALIEANLQLAVMRSALPGHVTGPGRPLETVELSAEEALQDDDPVTDVESARRALGHAEHRLALFTSSGDRAIEDAELRLGDAVMASGAADAELAKHYEGLERLLYDVSPEAVLDLAQIDQAILRYRRRLEALEQSA